MFLRCNVLPVALATLVAVAGCTRAQARRAPRPLPPSPTAQEYDTSGLAVAPTPPAPPHGPESGIVPPQADAIAGVIPPMRDRTRHDTPAVPTASGDVLIGTGPIRDRIQKRREERQERRDERAEPKKEPEPLPPPATLPGTPPTVAVPPGPPTTVQTTDEPTTRTPQQLLDAAAKRWASVTDFEARLIKREVVGGKSQPTDEMEYRFRQQPMSVYMRVLSDVGQGREVLYVHGANGNKMHVVTGKGDNILVGAGYKTEIDPESRAATSKSRHRISEAGMGRTIAGLSKNIDNVTALGAVTRKEYPYPLEGVEQTIRPGVDPLLPRGGRRQVYFDPNPKAPSYLLPVLVITHEPDGREVEYYCFDRMRVPANLTDADWSPERLGKRR